MPVGWNHEIGILKTASAGWLDRLGVYRLVVSGKLAPASGWVPDQLRAGDNRKRELAMAPLA